MGWPGCQHRFEICRQLEFQPYRSILRAAVRVDMFQMDVVQVDVMQLNVVKMDE